MSISGYPRLRKLGDNQTIFKQLGHLVVMGILGMALPFPLFAYAGAHIDSAISAMINGLAPLMTAVLAHYFISTEKLNKRKVSGIVLGCIGFVVIFAPSLIDKSIDADSLGMLAAFTGAISYAVGMVYAKNLCALMLRQC